MIDYKCFCVAADARLGIPGNSLDPMVAVGRVLNAYFEELVDAVNLELQALEIRLSGKPCPDDIRDLAESMCRKTEP